MLEPKVLYRSPRGEVPDGEHVVPLGAARIAREGTDVTLVAYGAMVHTCLEAAELLDASAEVVDVRSLKPLDEEAVLRLRLSIPATPLARRRCRPPPARPSCR